MNRGYIFIFLATVFFSSMEVALKTVAHDFNPMQLNCTRFLVGGLLLIPFALRGLRQHGARVTAAAWKGFAWLGFVGLVVSMMFYQMSILYAPASVVSVLFSCNPVLVLAFA
ncbi:DMT family transporter, partial [Desulfovibrio sp.]